jgi:hypothetical protein
MLHLPPITTPCVMLISEPIRKLAADEIGLSALHSNDNLGPKGSSSSDMVGPIFGSVESFESAHSARRSL